MHDARHQLERALPHVRKAPLRRDPQTSISVLQNRSPSLGKLARPTQSTRFYCKEAQLAKERVLLQRHCINGSVVMSLRHETQSKLQASDRIPPTRMIQTNHQRSGRAKMLG